jgi:nitroreductase
VDLESAIHTRRTHKVYGSEPVAREVLDELFELARWAPNHHLTYPWRFRVLGPNALERLKVATGEADAHKLDRAPTLVCVSALRQGDPIEDEEDFAATACAAFIVLLAAHGRGLAGYWRTPAILREDAGREALGVPDNEVVVGLLYLGPKRQEQQPPERAPVEEFVTYLD